MSAFREAFHGARWFGPYPAFDERFDYVLYVHDVDEASLKDFARFASEVRLLTTTLDECWALDVHMSPIGRGEIGELVYRGKTYGAQPGDPAKAQALCALMSNRASLHPGIRGASCILGVPANPPKKPHNLPEMIAVHVAGELGIRLDAKLVRKVRPTRQFKNLPNEEKMSEITGAYEATRRLDGESVVLVDDILESGTTLSYVADVLRTAGAMRVIGLVATKTLRG